MTTAIEIERVLREAGLTDRPDLYDGNMHSWRCSYPEVYGACSCFTELIDSLLAVMAP